MTVLVDSSVLIQAQRLPGSETTRQLGTLLVSGEAAVTGPVIMEYIRGARSQEELEFLTQRIVSLGFLEMDQAVWVIAGQLDYRLMLAGDPLANMDLILAATAIRHGVPLYTLDYGFSRIPELDLYHPSPN